MQLCGKIYALGGHNGLSIFDSVEVRQIGTLCKLWGFCSFFWSSVAEPDPYVPYVFGHPGSGSGSISMSYGSGSESGSFSHPAKIVRKTLIAPVLLLLYDFLSLKNDVNVVSKGNKQQTLEKTHPFSTPQTLLDVIKLILFPSWLLLRFFLIVLSSFSFYSKTLRTILELILFLLSRHSLIFLNSSCPLFRFFLIVLNSSSFSSQTLLDVIKLILFLPQTQTLLDVQ